MCRLATSSWRLLSSISLNSRTFSIAIVGLVGEGLDELDLLLAERAHLPPPQQDCPERLVLPHQRHRERRPISEFLLRPARIRKIVERGGEVLDMHGRLVHDRAAHDAAPRQRHGLATPFNSPKPVTYLKAVAIHQEQARVRRVAQLRRRGA